MSKIQAVRDFETFSEEEQIKILRFMYDTINRTYYDSELPQDIDIRICVLSQDTNARYKKPDMYDPTASRHRIEYNQLNICEKPFSHRDVWVSFLEDVTAHEMIHLFNHIRGITDVTLGKGYHNRFFKKAAIEHGQICERSNGRNGFSDTHLITHFPLKPWMVG